MGDAERSVRGGTGEVGQRCQVNRVDHAIRHLPPPTRAKVMPRNRIVDIVGAIVIAIAILSFLGLR